MLTKAIIRRLLSILLLVPATLTFAMTPSVSELKANWAGNYLPRISGATENRLYIDISNVTESSFDGVLQLQVATQYAKQSYHNKDLSFKGTITAIDGKLVVSSRFPVENGEISFTATYDGKKTLIGVISGPGGISDFTLGK